MLEDCKRFLRIVWWVLATSRIALAGIACLNNPCSHGICIDDINSTYSCYCVDGYTGVQCQTNWDECWSSPCQNGGTCIDGIASYNCSCSDGFIGDNCETNYNECESNPCLNNGTCIDMNNGYVCSCVPGFSGQHCEVDIAVCNATEEVHCYNGGQCIEGPGFKFYCKCTPGWAGTKCNDQVDECESNPCQNGGICIDVHADYLCACPFGYTGKSCETRIEFCDNNSCSNNALCVIEDDTRVCYCVPDFHGERCELQYDECLLGPRCTNGGTCIDGVDNFTCSCAPMFTGSLCECLILDDGNVDCEYISPTPLTASAYPNNSPLLTDSTTTDTSTYITSSNESISFTTKDFSISTQVLSTIPIIETTASSIDTLVNITDITTPKEQFNESSYFTSSTLVASTATETIISNLTQITTTLESNDSELDTTTSKQTSEMSSDLTTPTNNVTTIKPTTDREYVATTYTEETSVINDTSSENAVTVLPLSTVTNTVKTTVTVETPSQEAVTTTIADTTKEMMFTNTPTEHPVTEVTTQNISMTTEAMEETSAADSTSTSYTTTHPECTDTVCNNHGTCYSTLHGIRCRCAFNFGGRFCDEQLSITSAAFDGNSFIAHKLHNSTSIYIAFNARTLITDGQVMYVDIAKDVYMQLYMNGGLLKFKFSCGYQTMLLSELKTFVNRGYPMMIETRLDLDLKKQYCNATLQLNDTVAMSGGQVANISTLDHNSTLYLGSVPSSSDIQIKQFVGCIRDLTVNGDKRKIFDEAVDATEVTECSSLSCLSAPCLNSGSCIDHGDGYTCSCANGWMGEHCNQSVCDHNPCHSGGSCVLHPGSGFLCLCPYSKHGIFCEYNVDITRPSIAPISIGISSYIMYPLSSMAINSDRFDLRLRFQTSDMDQIALLAFIGQNGRHDSRSQHLALTFVKGYIMLTWNMGKGPRRIFTSRAISSRNGGHIVRVWRRGRTAGLNVDGRHNVSGNAPAHDSKMILLPFIYIGGHPSQDFQDLPHDLPLHSGWKGCIWEVGGQAIGPGKAIGGRGVGQCGVAQCTAKSCNAPRGVCIHSPATYGCICNEGWFGATCSATWNPCDKAYSQCQGRCVITTDTVAQCDCPYGKTGMDCSLDIEPTDVLFSGIRSYAKLHSRPISSVSLSLEAELKPSKERGLIMFSETPHFYSSLSLQGGVVEYRWTDRLSGVTSLVRSGVVLSMSQWHTVKAGRYGSRLYVWLDGNLSTEAMLAHAYPHTASNASVVLGGAKDLASLPFDAMSGPPEPFAGCIRNFHLNNVLITLERINILDAQNLYDCDGTACGGERCGGGACAVVEGVARCACAGRCRRHSSCTAPDCAPPRGRCRSTGCVCAAGYAGLDCQHRINITIPQFMGESLVALRGGEAAGRAGEQRLSVPEAPPAYLALNFTTAAPSGLLLWCHMDDDYLGIGLENGYLKIVWSLHKNNKTHESQPRIMSKSLPDPGFLADAEWHLMVVRLEDKVVLTVDGGAAYTQDHGLLTEHYDRVDLYIGGITDNNVAKNIFPNNFKGCIDHISTKEETYLTNYTSLYSENISSCQLIP